jgi:hypothetical protein
MIRDNLKEPFRYIFLSLALYIYVFFGLWVAVEVIKLNSLLAYIYIYASVYLIDYISTLKWVFKETHKNLIAIKYLIYLIFFLVLNSLIYTMLLDYLYFMNAAIVVAVILFPLRYITAKFFVYRQ